MGHQHLPLLASLGLTSVRHRDDRRRMTYPERTGAGVYKIFESMNLRFANYYDYVAKARVFLGEAQKHHAAFHIWFHPSDPWEVFEQVFDPILEFISAQRKAGALWVATMHELVSYCEARATTVLGVKNDDRATTIEIRSSIDEARFGTPDISLSVPVNREMRKVVIQQNGISVSIPPKSISRGPLPGTILLNVSCGAERLEISY